MNDMDKALSKMHKSPKPWQLKRIEELAYKWSDGLITSDRFAEAVFRLVNSEVRPSAL